MGNKKGQQRLQQSMGNMVSRAALAQLGPHIEQMVVDYVNQLGSNLSTQTASTLESMFSRIVVLETILIEKMGYTKEDLANKVADIEDQNQGLKKTESSVEKNDVVRLEIKTKMKEQTEYQGTSKLRISQIGSGQTLGLELESAIIGMKSGETKEVEFGQNKEMLAQITLNRVSRSEKKQAAEASNESTASQSQG